MENVIEGETPFERYTNFIRGVIFEIWPNEPTSGKYGADLYRAGKFNAGEIDMYSHSNPCALDPLNLNRQQFEILMGKLRTPDYLRVRSIPPQLLDEETHPVVVGGSCAIETHGMATIMNLTSRINKLKKLKEMGALTSSPEEKREEINRLREVLRNFVETLLNQAPTITHISGAILGVPIGIHYWETDMWIERIIEYDLSPEQATKMVYDAYQRIHEAVERRSRLINPNSILLAVNFDELDLKTAIEKWLTMLELEKALREYRVIEVIYTYDGPNQLSLLKDALRRKLTTDDLNSQEREAINELIREATHHLRAKQVDHLSWGSMGISPEVIMQLRSMTPDEEQRYSQNPAYRLGVEIMRWVFQRHTKEEPTSIALGFFDLPFGNQIQHMSRDVGFIFDTNNLLESIENQLTHPARLHRLNVTQHLNLLQQYISVDYEKERRKLLEKRRQIQEKRKDYIDTTSPLTSKLNRINQEITAIQNDIVNAQQIIKVINLLINPNKSLPVEILLEMKPMVAQIKKLLEKKRIGFEKKRNKGQPLSEQDEKDIQELLSTMEFLTAIEQGTMPELSEAVINQLTELLSSNSNIIRIKESQLEEKKLEQEQIQKELEEKEKEYCSTGIESLISEIQRTLAKDFCFTYFPLRDNPIIQHAMQFLFDPDFVIFLQKAVLIEQKLNKKEIDKETAIKELRNLMHRIYPKLESYIQYLFGLIDYPTEIRNCRVL